MQKINRSKLITAFILLVLGLVAVFSSTFAWLNVSRVPFISDLEISVITDNNLLITPDVNGKPDDEKWSSYLDASEFLKDMAPLQPVTYKDGGFYKLVYDDSGRADYVTPITEEEVTYAMNPGKAAPLDEAASRRIIALDFWMKCEGSSADVFLSDPVKTEDGQMRAGTYAVGTPIWSDEEVKHQNGGYGSETTLRLGFQVQHASLDGELIGGKDFYVYEPNADIHINPENVGYIETPGVDGGSLIDNAHHIIQNASRWNEVSPVLAETVVYQPGQFTQNRTLFTVKPTEMIKVRLYFWMEGQDVDCIARGVADEVSITSNIQFGVKEAGGRDITVVRK